MRSGHAYWHGACNWSLATADGFEESTGSGGRSKTGEVRLQMIDFSANQPVNKRARIDSFGMRSSPGTGPTRSAEGKESETVEKCTGIIKKVLTDEEVEQLRDLFAIVKRDGPRGDLVGVVDLTESPECAACPFRLSWGYTTYCENPDKLGDTRPGPETQP